MSRPYQKHSEVIASDGAIGIPLGGGLYSYVDPRDHGRISCYNWHLHRVGSGAKQYAIRSRKNLSSVLLHREIMSPEAGQEVDHVDGDGLNNRRSNLRCCTGLENKQNQSRHRNKSSSKYKGVFRKRDKLAKCWYARIVVNHQILNLGYFETEEEAAIAYDQAALLHHGKFAKFNLPEVVNGQA